VAVGYDRDFALLPTASSDPIALPRQITGHSWREIDLQVKNPDSPLSPAIVTLPPGCSLDLGATGKAWASDLLAYSIHEATGADVIISLGGDIRALGTTPWPITITETLDQPGAEVHSSLTEGGLATSTTMGRRWVRGGRERHHLLDPRTGEPTAGPWRTVSAFGPSAAAANTAATAAIVAGADALDWLTTREVPARLIAQDGSVDHTQNWPGAL
jgi:FAD:protein FMN transferase